MLILLKLRLGLLSTRRPCCRRKPLRDAGHLYRKLAPKRLAAQWIRKNTKIIANMGNCRKTTLQAYQWRTDACRRMVSRDRPPKDHEIRGI